MASASERALAKMSESSQRAGSQFRTSIRDGKRECYGRKVSGVGREIQQFVAQQRVFFVAWAPLSVEGHIDLSPKGLDCLRIVGPGEVAYVDLNGSGMRRSLTSARMVDSR